MKILNLPESVFNNLLYVIVDSTHLSTCSLSCITFRSTRAIIIANNDKYKTSNTRHMQKQRKKKTFQIRNN